MFVVYGAAWIAAISSSVGRDASRGRVDKQFLDELEKRLYRADVGTTATTLIVDRVRQAFFDKEISGDLEAFVKQQLRARHAFQQFLRVLENAVGLALRVVHDLPTRRIRGVARDPAHPKRHRIRDHDVARVEHHRVVRHNVEDLAGRHLHLSEPRREGARHHDPLALRRGTRTLPQVRLHRRH